MKVIILTSRHQGTPVIHAKELLNSNNIEIVSVIYNQGVITNKSKFYKKKIKKILKIGIYGTMIGFVMRSWFGKKTISYLDSRSIFELCSINKTPIYNVPSISSKETIKLFKEQKPDLAISLGNGYISSTVFELPKFGMINIHHEELPNYQNASSVIWQLYNKSSFSGYTIHKINKFIDKGDILYQERIKLTFKNKLSETVAFNYAKLIEKSSIGLKILLENYEKYENNSIKQDKGNSYTTPSIVEYFQIKKNHKNLKNHN